MLFGIQSAFENPDSRKSDYFYRAVKDGVMFDTRTWGRKNIREWCYPKIKKIIKT